MASGPATLCEALAARRGDAAGITFLEAEGRETFLAYGELYTRALQVLRCFQREGLRRGDEVVLCTSANRPLVEALWACLLGGLIAVPLTAGARLDHRQKLARVLATLRRPALVTERRQYELLKRHASADGLPHLPRTLLVEEIDAGSEAGAIEPPSDTDLAFIQFSSGSTGEPKGALITHRNVMSNIAGMRGAARTTPDDSFLSWMPLAHDMGIVGFHFGPLAIGANQYLIPTEMFGRRPLVWLEKASERRATVLGSPNFGYRHCLRALGRAGGGTLDLTAVRLIFNGAEPIARNVCDEFLAALAPHGLAPSTMLPVYGLAEATLGVSFAAPGAPLAVISAERASLAVGERLVECAQSSNRSVALVGVGRPIPGCAVRIADDRGVPLPRGHVGHLHIRGANVVGGYYGRPPCIADGFLPDGWFATGDLGVFAGDLFIVGRDKDVILINGQNIHPQDIERLCDTVTGVQAGQVACTAAGSDAEGTERIAIFVQYRQPLEEFVAVAEGVRKAVWDATAIEVDAVIPVRTLPTTSSGKLRRFVLREAFENNEYDAIRRSLAAHAAPLAAVVPAAEVSPTASAIHAICRTIIRDREFGIHTNIFSLEVDSLALTEIVTAIDHGFPGAVAIEDFIDYPTIAQLAQFIDAKAPPDRPPAL